ncbi:oxygen-independent coproporphyrinogen III oxidase [Rubritalea spongiae]|uniref:Coproporphyrinogen-III oxidase n=1 Tax=Rubritalea spongiae TaxID=430797 RepID=A0ABW5E577_9BACT
MLKPDLRLVEKYNKPGPRYTSYPTAPQFIDQIDIEKLRLEATHESGPLSLYFHIPFCQSMCWFCGCTKIISSQREPAEKYIKLLEREIEHYRENIQPGREVQQLHFGGGTPNYLDPDLIDHFTGTLHKNFHFAPNAEISAELDPRRLTEKHIQAFRRLGVNRVSFGVQDIQLKTQKAVNRVQSDEQNRNAIEWARAAGMQSLNIDLIYGLPYQTPKSIRNTIHQVLEYSPDRLAVFSYAHVPWMAPAQKILERHGLPAPEQKIKMLGVIIEELTSNGYQYIGMDHFAKVDDSLAVAQRNKTMQRNFQGYSTFKDIEIAAFGISSISQTKNSYRQNIKDIDAYEKRLSLGQLPVEKGYILTPDDHIRRTTIMRLMCDHSLDFHQLSSELNIDFKDHFANELNQLLDMEIDGLLERSENALQVTPQGALFIRNIAMHFDAHLAQSSAKHSKTV